MGPRSAARTVAGALVVLAALAACKRQPDPPKPPPPTPQQLADQLRPTIEALVREEKLKEAIELALVKIEDDVARQPLVADILAAADDRERRVTTELEELVAKGDLAGARARLNTVRAALPATTAGARFAALDKRLVKLAAEEADEQWARRYGARVDPTVIEAYGKANWRRLVEAVRSWARSSGDAAAVAGVAACAPPAAVLRAAIEASAEEPASPDAPVVARRTVHVAKRLLFGRGEVEGELAVEYAFALPRWAPSTRIPLLLSLYPPEAMDLAHVEAGLAQSFEMMARTGPFALAGAMIPRGLAWTDHPVGSVLAQAIARDVAVVAPIDPRRRYLDGPGDGGAGAWLVALADPAPWAGVAPLGAPFEPTWGALLPNLRDLAVHVSHRADDPVVPMAGAKAAVDALVAAAHPRVAVRALAADPEDQERAAREMIDYLLASKKPASGDHVQLRFVGPASTAVGGVRAVVFAKDREVVEHTRMTEHGGVIDFRFKEPAALAIAIRKNVVEVTPDGIASFELLVPAGRFDPDKPIEVVQKRRRLARVRLAPTTEQVLELARAYPDEQYIASIPITCHVTSWGDRFVERGLDPKPVDAFGREKFEALVLDLGTILDAPELDRAAIARVCAATPDERVLAAALDFAKRPRVVEPGTHQVRIDLASHPLPCYLYVPTIKPGQRIPLVIDLHGGGGGGGGDHLAQMADMFRGLSDQFGALAGALPHSGTPLGWGPSAPGLEQVSRVVRDLSRQLPIDPDRIYLSGFSMGAFGSWTSALVDPTPFAAIMPTAGRIHPFMLPLMSNLEHVGIYVVHREGDKIVPVDGARQAKAALEALGHTNLVYREYPGDEHAGGPPEAQAARMKWLMAQRRVAHPARVRMKVLAPRPTRHRDVVALEFDPERPVNQVGLKGPRNDDLTEAWFQVPAAIEVAFPKGANAVELVGVDGIQRLEILLDPTVFDLAKPVVVRSGARELYAGIVEATLATRLELVRRFPDADYRATIVIDTRGATDK